MDRRTEKNTVISKYEKLFHHLHVEFPELTELSSKTLETFNVPKRRKSATVEVFKKRIENVKKKQVPDLLPYKEFQTTEYVSYLQEAAKKCPITKMSRFQKKDIKNSIGVPDLQLKYEDKMEEMFEEIQREYSEITHAVVVRLKLKNSAEIPSYFDIQPFKHMGRTKNYKAFVRKRKELREVWMLHQPLLKSVINEFSTLPDVLLNIDRKNGHFIDFEELEYEMQRSLVEAARVIQDFYWKVEIMVHTDMPDLHSSRFDNFLGCCTCAISIHLGQIIENTLNYIVNLTTSRKIPLLNIYVTFTDEMNIFPTSDQTAELFKCLIKDVLALTKPLSVMRNQKQKKYTHKTLPLYLTQEFIGDCMKTVERNISAIYEPLMDHLEGLNEELEGVYRDITNGDTVISDLEFEFGREQINFYSSFYDKVSLIPEHELFDTGMLILTQYISKIRKGLIEQKTKFFNALASQNHWEMNDIYESFHIIRTRAKTEPLTTEQTMEIGKYMTWVKSEFIQDATERIGDSLLLLASLLQINALDDDQLELNVKVVKELDELEPLVFENLSVYEQSKFEAEENLQKHIETVNELTKAVHPILCLLDDMDDIQKIREYLGKINLHLLKIKQIESKIEWINTEEVSLSFPKSTYAEFEELKNYVYPFFHLMKLSLDVQRNVSVWLDGQFDLQSYDETKEKIGAYHKELSEMYKNYRKKLRQAQDENLAMRFRGTVDDPDILNWPAPLKICSKTIKLIDDFQPCLSLMKIVCNQSLRSRHWIEMSTIAKIDLCPNAGSTLRKLLTYDLKPYLGPLEIISQGASHEQELLEIILEMKQQWVTVSLKDDIYKETDLIIFSNLAVVIKFIEENMEKQLILSRSAFARPHKKIIEDFSNDMAKLKDILVFYEKLQEKFYHLLPFFTFIQENEETLAQTEEFNKVKIFKKNLYSTLKNHNIFDILNKEDILEDIQKHYNLFESIYFGVRQYLDLVRSKFPRFYFLSNEEIIEILSNITLDESIIQKYITKCFGGIAQLTIQNKNIVSVKSSSNEEINLIKPIKIDIKLVKIFVKTEKGLQQKLAEEIITASRSELNEEKIISKCLGQGIFIALEILCTFLAHQAINNDEKSLKDIELIVENYIQWCKNGQHQNSKRELLKSIIISLIQHKQFITKIISERIQEEDFIWLTKLKYYLENHTCVVKILNNSFTYSYEFYGDISAQICTPYTERCIVNLLCAYNSCNSGAIHGGACSGKTETFKNFCVALGLNHKIISCTDFITYDILERLLVGCSKGRMWVCLDEINKVDPSVLSLMSELLQNLNRLKVVDQNREIQSFVCTTLSAAFPKVTDLPMTFKSQLRSIGILPVDYSRLSELTLTAIGYQSAKYLSKCVDCLFKSLPHVLTKKWKTFSVKLLKKILKHCDKDIVIRLDQEKDVFVNAVRKNIQPMLSQDDTEIFNGVIERIFDISSFEDEHRNELRTTIVSYLKANHLHPEDRYVDRIIQVSDVITSKQTAILVGDIFGGKTKAINSLFDLISSGKGSLEVVNPSLFDTTELFGLMDCKYDLWEDGIVTKIFREFSTMNNRWLLFDGPIESYWIEALYSVLEKTRVFTLGSGDFLKIKDSNSIIFEVAELDKASPSLISRCSVVYFETPPEPLLTLVRPWVKKNYNNWPDNIQNLLEDLIFWLVPPLLKFIDEHCDEVYPMDQFYLVKRTVNYVQILLKETLAKRDEDIKNILIWLQASVFLGLYNGLAATLTSDSTLKFDAYFKQLSKNQIPEYPLPESIEKIDVNIPAEGIFSEYFYIYKGRGTFKYTPDTLKNEKVMFKTYIDEVMVPTTDTLRTLTILDNHIKNDLPVILTGPTGIAKTLCINHYVNHVLDKKKYISIFVKFIPRLTSKRLQSCIQSDLLKNISFNGENFKRKNVIVIEDLNIVTKNENKISTVVELLRQTLDYQFWYDTSNFEKIAMNNLIFVGTMGTRGGLYKNISKRLLKHFNIFRINDICDDNIVRIYSNILQVEWRKNGFAADIALVTNSLVNATLNVYQFCLDTFQRSPLKFSYSYNIWDFLKVLKGFFLLKKDSADTNKKIFYKLWLNECARVFGDRLLCLNEKNMLYKELMIVYELQFKECFTEAFNGLRYQEIDDKIIFGTITNGERYEEMDFENLKESLEGFTGRFQLSTGLKLVLFDEVLPQIIKLTRLISIDNCHGLLLGVSGTGRKTIIDLISFMHNFKVFTPDISYSYDSKKWHATFKNILLHTGGGGNPGILYVNEEHLAYRFILEDLNFYLKNGDIIDLFEIEEEPKVLNMVRLDAQCGNPNLNISSHDVYAFFVDRCKRKLHVFFSLNCAPTELEMRTSIFQSLVKYCTPVWFNQWSDDSLALVASRWLENCNVPTEIQTVVPRTFVRLFNDSRFLSEQVSSSTRRRFQVTTKTYQEFLKLYIHILVKERGALEETKEKYLTGLRKLKYADNQIKKLQEHLCAYQLQLRIMSKKAGDMTRQIAVETLDVERVSDLVKSDEKVANVQAEAAAILKADCEIDLAQAIPILEDAIQALNTLKPPDITLVKSMKNPPDAIKLVMAAVCVIKDVKPDRIPDPSTGRKLIDYWGPSKRILGDMNFLQSLKDFDKDHIKPEIMVKVRKDYLSHKDFKPHVVAKASSAAEGLCKWIIAMDMYDKVAKEVAPKKEKLEKAEREYAQTLAILEQKKLEVVRLEKQLALLNFKLQEANKKQGRLQKTADACNRKLERSVILITGFEDEKVQWSNKVSELDLKNQCLIGDVLLTTAFIAYLSPTPKVFREETVEKWYNYLKDNGVPVSDSWDLTTTLISNNLCFKALPQENYYLQNSIIYKYSQKYCLIIDPHRLAKIWIQKTVDKHWFHITKYGNTNFLADVKFCLESGKLLLIEKVGENISSCLNSILNNELVEKDNQHFIKFGDELITFNKNFQLILITTLKSPNYKTEISDKIRLIDFSITKYSIQKKLLSLVIKTENPLVSKQISIYKKKQKKNENLLTEYEEKILKTLSDAEADLLEDNKTLKILDDSKNAYKRINKEIYLPDKVVPTFETLEQNYTDFSHYASIIFYCIEEFCRINKVKFSYNQFLVIFRKSILEASLSKDPIRRIKNIQYCFTHLISRHIGRIVCPEQALSFLFHMSCQILLFKKIISEEELQFLYKNEYMNQKQIPQEIRKELNQRVTKNYENRNPADEVNSLLHLEVFKDLADSMKAHQNVWDIFLDQKDPENQQIPQPFQHKLNDFQKFVLLQTFRPDRTKESMKKLISNVLEEKYIRPIEIDLEELYAESFCLSPLLFLTTNNSSPLTKIKTFALRKKFHNKFRSACISKGDNTPAEDLIRTGQSEGLWVCILNCHLSKTWKYNLEKICELMTFENTNENFRLWLISDISYDLPSDLLEKCVRTVYGDTDSFKENLLVSYKDFVDDINVREYQNYSQGTVRFLYRLICFHNVIKWRAKYRDIAWNVPFKFGDYDLKFSLKFLPIIIDTYKSNESIDYFLGDSSYYGQFLNEIDYKVAKTLFNDLVNLKEVPWFSFPPKNDIHDFIAHIIEKLPSNETPGLFGFNEVSLRRKNIQESLYFTSYISLINPTMSNNNKEYEELKEIVERSYILIDVEIETETKREVKENMLESVLKQEMGCYATLKNHILKYLTILKTILSESTLLSPKLKEILQDLMKNKIPKKFLKHSFITNQTFSSYVLNLRKHLLFVKEWYENGLPESIWISVFFHPNAILTAQKMLYAQKQNIHLSEFTSMYEIGNSEKSNGFKICGLFLINAKFDECKSYLELLPHNVYFKEIPTICIRPLMKKKENSYDCPVYRTERSGCEQYGNFVFLIELETKIPKNTLDKLGVSLTCEKPREF